MATLGGYYLLDWATGKGPLHNAGGLLIDLAGAWVIQASQGIVAGWWCNRLRPSIRLWRIALLASLKYWLGMFASFLFAGFVVIRWLQPVSGAPILKGILRSPVEVLGVAVLIVAVGLWMFGWAGLGFGLACLGPVGRRETPLSMAIRRPWPLVAATFGLLAFEAFVGWISQQAPANSLLSNSVGLTGYWLVGFWWPVAVYKWFG